MRIKRLLLAGFRGFPKEEELNLDADAVLVFGSNGQGKTSIFDGILWALTGAVPRLRSQDSILSMFSESGEARVVLTVRDDAGQEIEISRGFDGSETHLRLAVGDEIRTGSAATTRLLELLWPQALASPNPGDALVSAIERAVYLQQDRVRHFVEAASEQERFAAISELVGVGNVNELHNALDRSRTAWSRATNIRNEEFAELADRETELQRQIERLQAPTGEDQISEARWQAWWASLAPLVTDLPSHPPADSLEAPNALDQAVRQVRAHQQSMARARGEAETLLAAIRALPTRPSEDMESLRQTTSECARALTRAQEQLAAAETQAAEARRQQLELREAREELRVFAELALRHLGEVCPVCGQSYDHDATRSRLGALAAESGTESDSVPDLSQYAQDVETAETRLAQANAALRDAEARLGQWSRARDALIDRARSVGIEGHLDELRQLTSDLIARISKNIDALDDRARVGERLALSLARVGGQARRAELAREQEDLRRELDKTEADITTRQETRVLATQLLEALRAATDELVEQQLDELDPLLQRMYASADPHPAFRFARLTSQMRGRRGRVIPTVEDRLFGLVSEAPDVVLSSSQVNVLAVSIFLALNLGVQTLPLKTMILDDPLQSLDDLNLLGLIDLLRRARPYRQIFVSTHDDRFASVLERKLRPIGGEQRTRVIDLRGWGRGGPDVSGRDLEQDLAPLRIAV